MAITKQDKDALNELGYLAATDHYKERVHVQKAAELLAVTNSIAEFNEGMGCVEDGVAAADINEYTFGRIRILIMNLARILQQNR